MTIPKHTNKAKTAIANAHNVRVYSLSNNFSGQPLAEHPVAWVRSAYPEAKPILTHMTQRDFLSYELFGNSHMRAKLSLYGDTFTLHIHDNLWYEFTTHDWTLEADDTRSCACGARRTEVIS